MKLIAALAAVIVLAGCVVVPLHPHRQVHAGPPPRAVIVAPPHHHDRGDRDARQRWRHR